MWLWGFGISVVTAVEAGKTKVGIGRSARICSDAPPVRAPLAVQESPPISTTGAYRDAPQIGNRLRGRSTLCQVYLFAAQTETVNGCEFLRQLLQQ